MWTNEERLLFQNEVESFFNLTSKNLQDLHRQLESLILTYMKDEKEESKLSDNINEFYNEIMKSLVQNLRDLTKLWEKTQKQREIMKSSPHRVFSSYYPPINENNLILNPSTSPSRSNSTSRSFSQRYTDEIASTKKMNIYEEISNKQFELAKLKEEELKNKNKIKKVSFNELVSTEDNIDSRKKNFSSYTKNFFDSLIDGRDSNKLNDEEDEEDEIVKVKKIEDSVSTISNMIIDFNSILTSQTDLVEEIEKDTENINEFINDTDKLLLKTLESEQKNSWILIILINTLTVLILLLHFFNP